MVSNCIESKENEIMRRRSWAALDDLTKNHLLSLQIVKQQKRYLKLLWYFHSYKYIYLICSASLSSMESETEDPFADSTANLLTTDNSSFRHQKASKNVGLIGHRFSGNSSTHSLNETDYQV